MRAGYHPRKNELKEEGFYKTGAWKRIRKLALQRDNYLCKLQISDKCTRRATEVHHIKPAKDYPEKALDLDNLISCCWWCHEMTKPRREEPVVSVRVIKVEGTGDRELPRASEP